MVVMTPTASNAAAWVGGTGVWHDPTGWSTGDVPDSAAPENFQLNADGGHLTANAATWTYLAANNLLATSTSYTGVQRALFGQTASGTQTVSFTLDIGDANAFLLGADSNNNFGERQNTTTTVNIVSGTMQTGRITTIANNAAGTATLNISGGKFTVGRRQLIVGQNGSDALVSISGGILTTRSGMEVDVNSTFEVLGSGATQIGIGSHLGGDGFATINGSLSAMIDAGGVTPIFVDDLGGGAAATFNAGSELDLGFLGTPAAPGSWTVLELEGADIIDNGLALSAATLADPNWEFSIDNDGTNGLLVATYIPEPSTSLLAGSALLLGLGFRRRKA